MQVHELTDRREGVRAAGTRELAGAPARLDSRRAAPPLSCDLFRSAGVAPRAADTAAVPPAAPADLSRRSPPRG